MKQIGNSVAQLLAMIMILITLAVSTAAVSQWVGADATVQSPGAAVQTQPLLASGGN